MMQERIAICGFTVCTPNSELAERYALGTLSADEFALWPRMRDNAWAHNFQTKYLGAGPRYCASCARGRSPGVLHAGGANVSVVPAGDADSDGMSGVPPDGRARGGLNINWLIARNDSAGRAMLARAKERVARVDVLGLTEQFDASLQMLERALGLPIDDVCACNVNPFKP